MPICAWKDWKRFHRARGLGGERDLEIRKRKSLVCFPDSWGRKSCKISIVCLRVHNRARSAPFFIIHRARLKEKEYTRLAPSTVPSYGRYLLDGGTFMCACVLKSIGENTILLL